MPAQTLNVVTWNLWFGGTQMTNGLDRQAHLLDSLHADILCLQECLGDAAKNIAEHLSVHIAQYGYDTAVLSPWLTTLLPTPTYPYATAAHVQTPSGDILVWSVHLTPEEYGPYWQDSLPEATHQVAQLAGERQRAEQVQRILLATKELLREHFSTPETPVIIAGDFNVPSPADWNGTIRPTMKWRSIARLLDEGYCDAFREAHPDPATAPGLTWSHIHTLEDEPRDRIDFIFSRGMSTVQAHHMGEIPDPTTVSDEGLYILPGECHYIPNHQNNAFASDHLLVHAKLSPAAQ